MRFFLCGQQCPLQASCCANGPSWVWRWRTSAWQCRMPAAFAEWNPTGQRWGIFWTWNVKTFAFELHYHRHLTFKLHILGSLFKSYRVEESRPERWSLPGILNVCGTKARLVQSQTRGSEGKKNDLQNDLILVLSRFFVIDRVLLHPEGPQRTVLLCVWEWGDANPTAPVAGGVDWPPH